MSYALWVFWILIWAAVGYFTVKAILAYNERKRMEKAMAAWMIQRAGFKENATQPSGDNRIVYNPFEGLL